MESFWARMQVELLDRQRWKTRIELANAIFEYLEIFHNRQRRHRPTPTLIRDPPTASARTVSTGLYHAPRSVPRGGSVPPTPQRRHHRTRRTTARTFPRVGVPHLRHRHRLTAARANPCSEPTRPPGPFAPDCPQAAQPAIPAEIGPDAQCPARANPCSDRREHPGHTAKNRAPPKRDHPREPPKPLRCPDRGRTNPPTLGQRPRQPV